MKRIGRAALVALALAALPAPAQVVTAGELWFLPGPYLSGVEFRVQTLYTDAWGQRRTMEVDGAWLSPHTRVQVYFGYERNGTVPGTVQKWLFLPAGRLGDGTPTFRLFNQEFGTYLEATESNGSVTVQPGVFGNDRQRWRTVPNASAGRGFSLLSVATGQALEVTENRDGGAIRLLPFIADRFAQCFSTVAYVVGPGFTETTLWNYPTWYSFLSRLDENKSVDLRAGSLADQATIQLWTRYTGDTFQHWLLWELGSGSADDGGRPNDGTHKVISRRSGKAMEVYGLSTNPGGWIVQWGWWDPGPNQQWYFLPSKTHPYCYIVNANSGLAMQPQGGSTADGTPLIQDILRGTDAQSFRIDPAR